METNKRLIILVGLLILIVVSIGVFTSRSSLITSPLSFAKKPTTIQLSSKLKSVPDFDPAKLEKYLTVEAALLGVSDNISIYLKDEPSGKDVSLNSVRSWIPASTIKAFVAIEAFHQRDLGLISFDTPVTIQAQNVVPTELETDEFPRLREGTVATIQQLVEAMIIQSDNTAYNTLLDLLDRRNINATLKSLGITQTVVGEKLNLDDNQFQLDLTVPGRQPNTITAKDFGTLFDLLYQNKITHSDEIVSIFKRQKINLMIPALLPAETIVAHKTGEWAPIYHDGGIVYKPDDPFLLSIFSGSNDPNVLSQLARVAYYQTSDVVGESTPAPTTAKLEAANFSGERIYLAQTLPEPNVLGVQTTNDLGERVYTVEPGDTLWSIAQSQYGSGFTYTNILDRNAIASPDEISAGQSLILPSIPGTAFPPPQGGVAINAADLGVTTSDLTIGKAQSQSIAGAILLPGSPLYLVKLWFEQRLVERAQTSDTKIDALLATSKARLAEAKRELSFGNVASLTQLLAASENSLRQASSLAKVSSNNEGALFRIREQRDLHFAVLADLATKVGNNQKDSYIDAVYAFYQKQTKEIQPAIASTHVDNPLQQAPIVGTVTQVQNNIATIKQDNGKMTQVMLTGLTPSRSTDQTSVSVGKNPVPGEKIAVVGQVTPSAVVTAQFVLHKIPETLPTGHRGTVLEIDPQKNEIKIRDTQGKIDTVVINSQTTIKSRDTKVSPAGIIAGSVIEVVGQVPAGTTPTPTSSSPLPSAGQPGATAGPSGSQGASAGQTPPTTNPAGKSQNELPGISAPPGAAPAGSAKLPGKTQVGQITGTTINASSVRVNKNASGKNEKVAPKTTTPGKPSGATKSAPPSALPPKSTTPESKKK